MMHKLRVLATVSIAAGVLLSGCSSDDSSSGDGDDTATTAPAGGGEVSADAGKALFASSCSSCHGPEGKGLPKLGKDLTSSEFSKGLSDDELVAFLVAGRSTDDPANTTGVAMPPKGGNPALSEDDLASIVAHLRTIEQ